MRGVNKVFKFKKAVSVSLLVFFALLLVTTCCGLIFNYSVNNVAYINSNGNIIRLELTERVSLEDDSIEKLSKKIKITSTFGKGELCNLVKVTNNDIMFDFVVDNQKYYFSAIGNSLKQITAEIYQSTTGTKTLYYKSDLVSFRDGVNSGDTDYTTASIKLGKDIDLQGEEWTPIGHHRNYNFAGSFDGQGYTISNFKITSISTYNNSFFVGTGFFGYIDKSCTIQNLKIDSATIQLDNTKNNDSGFGYGILLGHFGNQELRWDKNYDSGVSIGYNLTIKNVSITNSNISVSNGLNARGTGVDTRSYSMGIGGLMGSTRLGVSIKDCYVQVNISFGERFGAAGVTNSLNAVGGIVGAQIQDTNHMHPYSQLSITNCLYDGSITFPGGNNSCVSGILGASDTTYSSSNASVYLENNYAYLDFEVTAWTKHPICGGNRSYENSGYSAKFYTKDNSYSQWQKPYYNVYMINNYFALKSNNTHAKAVEKFTIYCDFYQNNSSVATGSFSYDGTGYVTYKGEKKSSDLLYQKSSSSDTYKEKPIQVDPNNNYAVIS